MGNYTNIHNTQGSAKRRMNWEQKVCWKTVCQYYSAWDIQVEIGENDLENPCILWGTEWVESTNQHLRRQQMSLTWAYPSPDNCIKPWSPLSCMHSADCKVTTATSYKGSGLWGDWVFWEGQMGKGWAMSRFSIVPPFCSLITCYASYKLLWDAIQFIWPPNQTIWLGPVLWLLWAL